MPAACSGPCNCSSSALPNNLKGYHSGEGHGYCTIPRSFVQICEPMRRLAGIIKDCMEVEGIVWLQVCVLVFNSAMPCASGASYCNFALYIRTEHCLACVGKVQPRQFAVGVYLGTALFLPPITTPANACAALQECCWERSSAATHRKLDDSVGEYI